MNLVHVGQGQSRQTLAGFGTDAYHKVSKIIDINSVSLLASPPLAQLVTAHITNVVLHL